MVRQGLNDHWMVGEKASVTDLAGTKGDVKGVTLPYDAAIHEIRDPKMPDGYQKGYFPDRNYQFDRDLEVPADWADKSVYVEFEGVFRDAEVLLNKNAIVRRHHGYTAFTVCLDPFLNYGAVNHLTVTAKSGREQHWYSGCGIYRPVNLLVGELIHIAPDGVRITPTQIEEDEAVILVETIIVNRTRRTVTLSLSSVLHDLQGNVVGEETIPVTVLGNTQAHCSQRIWAAGITRWSPECPVLYVCDSTVSEAADAGNGSVESRTWDGASTRFGIRSLSVDAKHGFRLNGEEIKLRGGCIHHDAGIIGGATFKAAERRRIRRMKEAGFNAVRMAHHSSSRALLEACDEEGMLLLEETFNVWNVIRFPDDYSAFFDAHWKEDLAAIVANDYNHPSVIMYCIGNEIQEIVTAGGKALCREVADEMRLLDPTRYNTLAINGMVAVFSEMDKFAAKTQEGADINQAMVDIGDIMQMIMLSDVVGNGISEAADTVDIAGYNYMHARYEMDSAQHPNRVILGTEEYPREIDRIWGLVRRHANIIGDFTWTGWNYLGEAGIGRNNYGEAQDLATSYLGEYPWIGSACGDFDITGNRNVISYYREIVYGLRRAPYIAVYDPANYGVLCQDSPWGWPDAVSGWSWSGYEGKGIQVAVYADADEVVLYKNNVLIGRAVCGEEQRFKAVFDTTYKPGILKALALSGGEIIGEYTLETAGDPILSISAEEGQVPLEDDSLIYVDIAMKDGDGRLCHACNPAVTLSVEGPGVLMGFGGGATVTEERYDDNIHTAFRGRLLAILRPTGAGTVTVTAKAEGFDPAQTSVAVTE